MTRCATIRPIRRCALVVAMMGLLALALAPGSALAQLQLGLQDPGFVSTAGSATSQLAFGALQGVHGSTIRVAVGWASVAPGGAAMPSGFDPANPGDPRYHWSSVDTAVRGAAQHHDRVLISVDGAPQWAQPPGKPAKLDIFGGAWDPSAAAFEQFMKAAALRYSGHLADPLNPGTNFPRVSDWEIWNEENLPEYLSAPNLVSEYRSLLNAGYRAVKSVNPNNIVSMGGLAPVSFINGISMSPLSFAAAVLCLHRTGTTFVRVSSCPSKAHLDVLSIHPYSLDATPTKHAYNYNDILVGDVGKLDALLSAAERLGTAAPRIKYQLWADEWSWFTNPPDTAVGDAPLTSARYTAYSMYEMWRAGVSLVIWFRAMDPTVAPTNSPSFIGGGGLYTSTGKPKPMMAAFTFPVVAGVSGGRGVVWGRAPVSKATRVVIQQRVRGNWRTLTTTRTSRDGIFEVHFAANGNGNYRARIPHGTTSLAYWSAPIPGVRTH